MADIDKLVEELSGITLLEAADLVKALEDKLGVSAAAPVAVAAAGGGGGDAAPAAEKITVVMCLWSLSLWFLLSVFLCLYVFVGLRRWVRLPLVPLLVLWRLLCWCFPIQVPFHGRKAGHHPLLSPRSGCPSLLFFFSP